MPLMLSKTKYALRDAGAFDEKARAAVEEPADSENRLASIDNKLSVFDGHFIAIEGRFQSIDARFQAIETKLNVVIWAIGINAAATIAILGVLLPRP
ncbi:MAG: hypothetical protein ACREE2_01575 [Stellaceae bacterium]